MAPKIITRPKGSEPLPLPPGLLPGTATTVPKQSSTPVTIPGDTKLPPAVPNAPIATVPTTIPSKIPPTLQQKEGKLPLPPGLGITVPENAPGLGRSGMAVPKVITPPKYVTSPDLYEARRDLGQATIDTLRAGADPKKVESIVQGEPQPSGGWRGVLAKTLNFDVIPGKMEFKPVMFAMGPLTAYDTFRRAGVGAFTESVEAARGLLGKTQTYKATDYIPVHPQTGMPIAKVGDPVIINEKRILNTPIPGIGNITTAEAAQKATEDLSNKYAISEKGSWSDFKKQLRMDSTFGFGDIPYLQTGNKWVDRTIGLFGDLALDITNYASGPGALTKAGYQATVGKASAKAAKEAAELALKETLKEVAPYLAAKKAADLAAAKAAKVATDVVADTATTAAEKAAAQAAATAAEDAAAKAAKDLAGVEWTVTKSDVVSEGEYLAEVSKDAAKELRKAPRRVYGAGAKETMANTVREIRDEAQAVIDDVTSSVTEKEVAQTAVNVLTDDLIGEIATKGYAAITGDAANLLGVKGGIRIGLPTLQKFTIPGTDVFTNLIGKGVAKQRIWFVNTPKGAAILNRLVTAGENGLLGSEQIKNMRVALRQGTVTGKTATDYVTLLNLDTMYRGNLNLTRKFLATELTQQVTKLSDFKKGSKGVYRYLDTDPAEWAAKGLPPLSKEQQSVYDAVNNFTDQLYSEANELVSRLGGPPIGNLPAYFPHAQSAAALEWGARNTGRLKTVAAGLGVDPTELLAGNYLNRQLVEGADWFGYKLTAADVAGGIDRFNEIARQYGKVKFDFFTTDVAEALAKYADNHARFMSYGETILGTVPRVIGDVGVQPGTASRLFKQVPLDDTGKAITTTKPLTKKAMDELTSAENIINNIMTPEKLTNWTPAQIQNVVDMLDGISAKLGGSKILKGEFDIAVDELKTYVKQIDEGLADGTITPPMAAMLTDEAESYAIAVATQANKVKGEFLVSDIKRWDIVSDLLEDGFTALNKTSIPNIAVDDEVRNLITNFNQLNDPELVRKANILLKDYTSMFKTTATASIGFHQRNALGNVFMLIAAGGNPKNLVEGLKVYREVKKMIADGVPVDKIYDVYKGANQDAVINALALSGATGYGQFGEITQAAGVGKTGIFGRQATGLTPFTGRMVPYTGKLPSGAPKRPIPGAQSKVLEKASTGLAAPLRGLRKIGNEIEESTRFALLYDGIVKGYSPQEAANRVNKYLIDYSELNTLDKYGKSIIPFWMWASRNLPLQLENMWMNPKAYNLYNSVKRNLRDEEAESPFIPDYTREQGAFKIPNVPTPVNVALGAIGSGLFGGAVGGIPGAALGALTGGASGGIVSGPNAYLNPQLGFPGAGPPNQLESIASGNALDLLSSLVGPLRVPLEQAANKQFFSGAPIRKEGDSDQARKEATLAYWISQLVPQAGLAGRILSAIPGDEPKIIQQITGSKLDKELQAAASYIGSPGFRLLPAQEKNEIRRRYYQLQALKNRELNNNPDLPG